MNDDEMNDDEMNDNEMNDDDDLPLGGDYVEIDWEPIQAAIDVMDEFGLDLDDTDSVRDHLAVLLASMLRKVRSENEEELDEEALAQVAVEVAMLAVEIALGEEEVPEFKTSIED